MSVTERLVKVPMEPFSWRSVSRRSLIAIAGLVLLRAAVYVYLGAQLVMDDWGLLDQVERHGILGADLRLLRPRPLAWAVDGLVYGGIGRHPLILFLVMTVLNLVTALLVYVVGIRFVRSRTAFFVAALWVVAANHNTITVWTAAAPTLVAASLLLTGILLMTSGRWIAAAICLAVSVLAYELTIPLALAAAIIVPSAVPLHWKQRVLTAIPTLVAAVWVFKHPTYTHAAIPHPDFSLLWRAHFSDGLLGTADGPLRLVHGLGDLALVGLACCLVAWVLGERGREDGPWLALCGFAVLVLGSAGSLRVGLNQQSVGLFDRLLALSSIGSVMVLVGIAQLVWRKSRLFATAGAVVVCAAIVAGQFVSLRSWAAAGDDAIAVLHYVDAIRPEAGAPVHAAIGPQPRVHNGVPSSERDYDMFALAYRMTFGEDLGSVRTIDTTEGFEPEQPGEVAIDWTWIDNAAIFEEGVGFIAAVDVTGPGQATVYGWVEDGPPDSPPVEVEFLVDGDAVGRGVADQSRGDLAAGRPNPNHAFQQVVEVPGGTHEVCARTVGHGDLSLGCETVHVEPAGIPVGALETVEASTSGEVNIAGWAADSSAGSDPIEVRLEIEGDVTDVTADQPRTDIEAGLAWHAGPNHGFAFHPDLTSGWYTVCATALNVGEGEDVQLGGCRRLSVP